MHGKLDDVRQSIKQGSGVGTVHVATLELSKNLPTLGHVKVVLQAPTLVLEQKS